MTAEFIMFWSKETLRTALLVTGPILAAGMVVGLAVGIFQSVTQINEMTLTFVPKIAAVVVVLFLLMPWLLNLLVDFAASVFQQITVISK